MRGDGAPEGEGGKRPSAATPRRQLVFRSQSLAEPFRDIWDENVTIAVESVVQLDDGTHLQYWTVRHREPQRLIETVEQFPTTLDAELVSTVDDTHRFEVHGARESLFTAFEAFDGVTLSAAYDADGVDVVGEFAGDVDTDAVVEAGQAVYPDLELVDSYTVETLDTFRHLVRDRLTQRQLTVLHVAYFSGYYERPRRRSGAELADRLGISKQAFHDHLRKAHATVFEALIGNETELHGVDK
ncbi:helix-turn-helix domain-containing protein [Haloarcula onubensis]|uniref:Helix-turn-helix domain-containing protein n=1 Tax=Haloarcula onubensis TaxID=2950539 RepID=A0ABU2FLA4_9EURY|nr:helix-turn-helix domain-containing protein [Halomicroarcula sp. S3CR25-11]MDS0281087.1 helix-turn-helix domain-containing protein [Halomicroarcula sp. S3CR25-11]